MYRHQHPNQLKMDMPFGVALDEDNCWVRLAKMIPWEVIDEMYRKQFESKEGQLAKSSRLAFGALYIQKRENFTDEQTRRHIQENPYMQYFCGFECYTMLSPFDQSMMTHFRKRIPEEMIQEINAQVFKDDALEMSEATHSGKTDTNTANEHGATATAEDSSERDNSPCNTAADETSGEQEKAQGQSQEESKPQDTPLKNRGTLILDGTCVPADIHFPTDIHLLNRAREIAEAVIDTLYEPNKVLFKDKPRTYRENARKEYVLYQKKRKHTYKERRRYIHRFLLYLKRDLQHIEAMIELGCELTLLSKELYRKLLVIQEVHRQQWEMYNNKTNQVADRIVSIAQPHVRPIVRGKAGAPTEFGAKVVIGLVGGYAFVITASWDNISEPKQLIKAAEEYKRIFGCYPERILGDRAYPTNENRAWCNQHGIRLSGPRKGRKSEEETIEEAKQLYQDGCDRIPIEGTFGVCKRRYDLDRISTRLPNTSMSSISMGFFVANMERKMRLMFCPDFFWSLDYDFTTKTLVLLCGT